MDLARALLDRADDDVTLVRRVIGDDDIADAIVGFHAQQAVEKAIKAVLAAHGVEYAKTHQLAYLIDLLEKHQWAVDFRYETEDEPALDRRAALASIENIRAWAGTSVGACAALLPGALPQWCRDQAL